MHNTPYIAFSMPVQQGPTMSIVTYDLSWQSSAKDNPQAQRVFVPIFGEHCLSEPLT